MLSVKHTALRIGVRVPVYLENTFMEIALRPIYPSPEKGIRLTSGSI